MAVVVDEHERSHRTAFDGRQRPVKHHVAIVDQLLGPKKPVDLSFHGFPSSALRTGRLYETSRLAETQASSAHVFGWARGLFRETLSKRPDIRTRRPSLGR